MTGPAWTSLLLAGVMAVSALVHAGRLLVARQAGGPPTYAVDATHLAMSVGMASTLLLPHDVGLANRLTLVMAVPAIWFLERVVEAARGPGAGAAWQPARQLVLCAAMLVMLVLAGGSSGMTALPGPSSGSPEPGWLGAATLVLVALLAAVAAGQAGELRTARADREQRAATLSRGRCASIGCQLAMTAAMGYLLLPMAA